LKWFRHESRAHRDSRLQKLVMKYGFEGYGLYWYCVENICDNLEPKLTFELEPDSEILAHIGRMDSRLVEEIMLYMINVGLFESADNLVTCLKLARYLGEKSTRNQRLIGIIKAAKQVENPELSRTVPDGPGQSATVPDCPPEIREDKRRKRLGDADAPKSKKFIKPSIEQVADYVSEKGYGFDPEHFVAHHEARGWKLSGGQPMKCWKSACTTWQKNHERWGHGEKHATGDFAV